MQNAAHVYKFYDTHAHLDFSPFIEDMSNTIDRFKAASVESVMIPAVSRNRFDTLLSLESLYRGSLNIALGLHPLYIDVHEEADIDHLESLLKSDKQAPYQQIKAIGEIGLDTYLPHLSADNIFQKQLDFLRKQLVLANQFKLPVILHSRKTHHHLVQILKQFDVTQKGVVHGFSGSLEQALAFIKLGFKVGVGGVITYTRASKTRHAISQLPLSSLLLETDAPDMPLFGKQGQANRSEYVTEVFEALCALRKETPEMIAETIWRNSIELFH